LRWIKADRPEKMCLHGTENAMHITDLVELARICQRRARQAENPAVAEVLRCMAREYQQWAAQLNGGKLPDIDEDLSPALTATKPRPFRY
jgi:hypothetical protein